MERLTEWDGGQTRYAYYPRCFEEPCYGSGCKIKDCPFETAVCERLAAYEDTGLTPEEVERSKLEIEAGCIKAIARTYGIDINRLRKFAEADKDGLVVVLPCKAGTPVWRITWTFATYPDKSKQYVRNDTFFLSDLLAFGKTVFLTREEAEKALQKMEGKKDG